MRWGSGQVVRVERQRGPVWYARYRLPSGRPDEKLIGPAWSERGRPPAGRLLRRVVPCETAPAGRRGDVLWQAIATRILIEPITGLRDLGFHGLNCEVDIRLTIAGRTTRVRTVWNYEGSAAAPRLVSAYPAL